MVSTILKSLFISAVVCSTAVFAFQFPGVKRVHSNAMTTAAAASEQPYRKRSDIENILSKSASQPIYIYSARLSKNPPDPPKSTWYINGKIHYQQHGPPKELEISCEPDADLYGISYWDRMPCDYYVTYPDYFPNIGAKSSVLIPDSTGPACPMVYNFYLPEAFVDQDELLYARSIKSLPALRAYINARMWWIAYNHKRKPWGHACILGGCYLP